MSAILLRSGWLSVLLTFAAPTLGLPSVCAAGETDGTDVLVLPGVTYNSDDGLGVGLIASFRGPKPAGDDLRPYLFDITGIVLGFFNPRPNAWGLNWTASWYPEASGNTEVQFLVHSIGWKNAWFGGLGNAPVTEVWRRGEDDTTSDPWHRYGLFDLTLGARLERKLRSGMTLHSGARIDYDHLVVSEQTLLAAARAEGAVLAPSDALSITGEFGLSIDTAEPSHDPTKGGTLRGALYLSGGSAGAHAKALFDLRGYLRFGPEAPVVLAATVLGQMQWGDIPFYELSVLGDPTAKPRLVTGGRGVRGLRRGQLRGPLNLLMMSELRFRLPTFSIKKLRLRTLLVASADLAWATTYSAASTPLVPHPGFGGGVRVILNEQLVVHVDLATAPSDHLSAEGMKTEWGGRGYASVGQIF
jgi:hypothetical protein